MEPTDAWWRAFCSVSDSRAQHGNIQPTGHYMIFGFNTDIKHADTVYHVQSEVRQNERTLQSQVFVRGRCVGKHSTSFAERTSDPDFSEAKAHELLKVQHRDVLNAIREGKLDEFLGKKAPAPAAPPATAAAASVNAPAPASASVPAAALEASPLALHLVKADTLAAENVMALRFRVTVAGLGVVGARIISRVDAPSQASVYAQADTESDGTAEMRFPLQLASAPDAALLVQASYLGMSAKHKFRLRRG